ncbi:MAG: HEAT repeat domain-containing protein, partial [Candidatus Thorarchaeota archaeon]
MNEFDNNLKSDRISVLEHILLTSKNENEKLEAITQLMKKSDNRAHLAMLKALEDKSCRVREKALNSIKQSRIRDEILVEYLLPLINEESPNVRGKAIQLLKEMANEELLPHFLNKLNDESDLVRSMAIQAIG